VTRTPYSKVESAYRWSHCVPVRKLCDPCTMIIFEPITAMLHKSPNVIGKFIRFTVQPVEGSSIRVTLTPNHLIFKKGQSEFAFTANPLTFKSTRQPPFSFRILIFLCYFIVLRSVSPQRQMRMHPPFVRDRTCIHTVIPNTYHLYHTHMTSFSALAHCLSYRWSVAGNPMTS
jgi:hypothetical protein